MKMESTLDLNKILDDARKADERLRARQRRQQAVSEVRHRKLMAARTKFIDEHLMPASVEDYKAWLRGYMERGGKTDSVYNRPFPADRYYVAVGDIAEVPKLCGALAINIIVPEYVRVPRLTDHMPYGHCNLYFMAGYAVYGSGNVPIYNDVRF